MKKWTAYLFLMLLVTSVTAQHTSTTDAERNQAYSAELKKIYENSVPIMKSADLKRKLGDNSDYVLLDSRERNEYFVSHIRGALWIGYSDFSVKKWKKQLKNKKIVVYCSIGYRSERVGEQLLAAGYTEVYNLYGGIFDWINNGYPVRNVLDMPTERVHAYSKDWSKWLYKGKKVYE